MPEYVPKIEEITELKENVSTGIEDFTSQLYHYTTAEIAEIITTHKTLRFTCVSSLQSNDPYEIVDAYDLFVGTFMPLIEENAFSVSEDELRAGIGEIADRTFVACFSYNSASNYLFENYATRGSTERGAILQFDTHTLINSILQNNNHILKSSHLSVGKIVYSQEVKIELLNGWMDYINKMITYGLGQFLGGKNREKPLIDERVNVWKYQDDCKDQGQCFRRKWSIQAVLFTKKDSYQNEEEIRIAITLEEDHYQELLTSETIVIPDQGSSYIELRVENPCSSSSPDR